LSLPEPSTINHQPFPNWRYSCSETVAMVT
jgi:hypothetical protein